MKLLHGDCLELLPQITDGSIDLILCDPPYGTTECKWDTVLPMDRVWEEYRRVLKPNGVAALFSAQPFTTTLINSNRSSFRYCWYWVKNTTTGFAFARYQPMRKLEEVCIFICNVPRQDNTGKHMSLRQYMLDELKASGCTRKEINRALGNQMASHYFTMGSQFALPPREQWETIQRTTGRFTRSWDDVREEYNAQSGGGHHGAAQAIYNPQGLKPYTGTRTRKRKAGQHESIYRESTLSKEQKQKYTGFPSNVLYFDSERGHHPTQKPVPLLEYLIKTYTNDGGTVLDNCMGSGSTGVACVRTGRHFIGMEKDPHHFQTAQRRIEQARKEKGNMGEATGN